MKLRSFKPENAPENEEGKKEKGEDGGNAKSPSTTHQRENWDQDRAKHIQFKGQGDKVVTCLQFDADKIVAGYDDLVVEVYNIRSGEPLHFVGDTLVARSTTDRTVRVWDLEKAPVFRHHTSTVRCLQLPVIRAPGQLKLISPGRYEGRFEVDLEGSRLPSSSAFKRGKVEYFLEARIIRKWSVDIVQKQTIWFLSTTLPPIQTTPTIATVTGKWREGLPYFITLPSDVLFIGQ